MKIKSYLLKMPEDLHKDLKWLSVVGEVSMQDEMIEAISNYVDIKKKLLDSKAV